MGSISVFPLSKCHLKTAIFVLFYGTHYCSPRGSSSSYQTGVSVASSRSALPVRVAIYTAGQRGVPPAPLAPLGLSSAAAAQINGEYLFANLVSQK